ncbi:MAG: DUF3718 domain-containing protein [Neptunomonas phycophila]|uniref:DUF3718 domain-containing protein n=1 Tax=Neptunomonas phycophila TaxID=1572645 RepID=UPI003B8DCF28
MKYFVFLFAVMMSVVSVPSHSANIAQTLCEYVAVDDKKRMRSFLKTNKLKIRSIFKGVQCNNQDLLSFADNKGSTNVGAFIIGKLPKKIVSTHAGNIKNATLQSAISKRLG